MDDTPSHDRRDRATGTPDRPESEAGSPASGPAPSGSVRPVDLRDYVDFSQGAATRVRVYATEHLALDLWCIEPQQATPVLRYDDQETTYTVLGGRSWFVTDDGEVGLDPLGAVLIRSGVVHGIDNRGADPLIVVAVSSPPSSAPEDPPTGSERAAVRHEEPGPGRLRRLAERILGTGPAGP